MSIVKTFSSIVLAGAVVTSVVFAAQPVIQDFANANAEAATAKFTECNVPSNVGDGQTYSYTVTEVKGEEIHGVPLDKYSCTNKGIFLLKDEVSFEVNVGDAIEVVWGENEDEFASIEKK